MDGRSEATPGPQGALIPAARRDPLANYRRAFESDGASSNNETHAAPNAHKPVAVGPIAVGSTATRTTVTLDPRTRSRMEFARWLLEHGRLSEEL
jgi:hypothetical protein